jgi:transposase-like protein
MVLVFIRRRFLYKKNDQPSVIFKFPSSSENKNQTSREPVMRHIVPEIAQLQQHLISLKEERYRYERCPRCGIAGLWRHGCYHRKVVRHNTTDKVTNPIPIPRFFCPRCKRTCSALPECIAPRRWYLWSVQQAALLLIITGNSLSKIAKKLSLSRHTVSRWIARCKERFRLHYDVLCNHFAELSAPGFTEFWQNCCDKMTFSRAMYLCNISRVDIP